MSVFRVKLQNPDQGRLDIDPETGLAFTTSVQRTMNVAGPGGTYRELNDGDTFTDCNYWKRFAQPQVAADVAFIEVVTDDGSVYSDVPAENTFPVTYGGDTTYTVAAADTFDDNQIDIMGDHGTYAISVEVENFGSGATQDIKVRLNGSDDAVFRLPYGESRAFNDLPITQLAFEGGSANTTIQVILWLRSTCNS